MTKNVVLKKAKKLRVIGSSTIDLIFAIVLTVLIAIVVSGIFGRTEKYNNYRQRHTEILVNSHLYEESNGTATLVTNDIDTAITAFLTEYSEDGMSEYKQTKLNSGYFTEDGDNIVVKNDVAPETITKFYKQVLVELTSSNYTSYKFFDAYLGQIEDAREVYNYLKAIVVIELIISFLVAVLIYYVILPMTRKDNKTFGKMFFHLAIYSKKGNLKPSKIQILFRELSYIFFELLLSLYTTVTFYVPVALIFSLLMMLFTKYGQTFHDFVCQTIVVDEEPVAFNTRESDKIYLTVVEDDNG